VVLGVVVGDVVDGDEGGVVGTAAPDLGAVGAVAGGAVEGGTGAGSPAVSGRPSAVAGGADGAGRDAMEGGGTVTAAVVGGVLVSVFAG
jgi:hypothetical protein